MDLVTFDELSSTLTKGYDHVMDGVRTTRKRDDKASLRALADLLNDLVIDLDRGHICTETVDKLVPAMARALRLPKMTRMGPHGDEEVWATRSPEESSNLRMAQWLTEQLRGFKAETPELPE